MNGLEFAPEEAVISWKGAFGSQRGFSDTAVGYFAKHQSLRNLNTLKDVRIGGFLVMLSNCEWQFEEKWVDIICRMLLLSIFLRPNFILKDEFQQGIFLRKIKLVLDEKVDEKPDLNIQYLGEYFN